MIVMKNPSHPGRVLWESFMKPLGLSASELAGILGVTQASLDGLLREESGMMTVDMARRLSQHFSNSPEFWMNMQQNFDRASEMADTQEPIEVDEPSDRKSQRRRG